MQYVSNGAIDAASSSEPMGLWRVCQSKPRRGMPRPPSFITTFGHAATAAMPRRHVASTSVSVGWADPHQATNMVRDNSQVRDSPGAVRQLGELGEVWRILETQTPARQHPRAKPESGRWPVDPPNPRFSTSGWGSQLAE